MLIFNTAVFLFGGLGLFLMGMKFLSDGLQTVAGSSLKNLIGIFTNNRFLGVFVGILVTTLLQSSSITSVMVIGFVNAELMVLRQAIGVIMGANVGTTTTGWLLALDIGKYGIPLAGVFGLIYSFTSKEKIKYSAYAVLGLGLLFMGLEAMKAALAPLAESPEFLVFLTKFNANTFEGLLKCVLAGTVLTAIMQSSSGMLGVTIAMAHQGFINFETSAAIVLGANIGTTVTGLLASIGTSRAARRTSLFNILFNVLGTIWVVILFKPFIAFIAAFISIAFKVPDPDLIKMTADGLKYAPHATLAIATFHTVFNVINLIVLLPFTNVFARVLETLVKQKAKRKKNVATKLDDRLLASPFVAISQSNREILHMNKSLKNMMDDLKVYLEDPSASKKQDAIFDAENHLDLAQEELTNFLTKLLSNRASRVVAVDAERHMRMSDDIETASDYATQVLKLHLRMEEKRVSFDKEHFTGIIELHDKTTKLIEELQVFLEQPIKSDSLLSSIRQHGSHITSLVRDLRSMHWSHLSEALYDPLVTTTYTDVLNAYRKIKEHIITATEAGCVELHESSFSLE